MNEIELLIFYKSFRLPLLILVLSYILYFLYNKRNREKMEIPKYRMMEED